MSCLKNAQEITGISLLDRAFHYGDGCFSTARVRDGAIELEALHMARLSLTCERLKLKVDLSLIQQSLSVLEQQCVQLNGTLKIIISRGDGQRGYHLPDHVADVWVFFYPHAVQDFEIQKTKSGVLQQALGLTMPSLVGLKTLNRLEQVLLKHEADQKDWEEALVTDVQGSVVEGVSSNCFIRLNNTWITPELRYNGVHGVMRAEILSRMQKFGIACQKRFIDMEEISKFESVFFCNALTAMKIATELNQRPLNVQPCTELFNILQLNQIH